MASTLPNSNKRDATHLENGDPQPQPQPPPPPTKKHRGQKYTIGEFLSKYAHDYLRYNSLGGKAASQLFGFPVDEINFAAILRFIESMVQNSMLISNADDPVLVITDADNVHAVLSNTDTPTGTQHYILFSSIQLLYYVVLEVFREAGKNPVSWREMLTGLRNQKTINSVFILWERMFSEDAVFRGVCTRGVERWEGRGMELRIPERGMFSGTLDIAPENNPKSFLKEDDEEEEEDEDEEEEEEQKGEEEKEKEEIKETGNGAAGDEEEITVDTDADNTAASGGCIFM